MIGEELAVATSSAEGRVFKGKGLSYNSAPVRKEELNEKREEDFESVSPKVTEEEGGR